MELYGIKIHQIKSFFESDLFFFALLWLRIKITLKLLNKGAVNNLQTKNYYYSRIESYRTADYINNYDFL